MDFLGADLDLAGGWFYASWDGSIVRWPFPSLAGAAEVVAPAALEYAYYPAVVDDDVWFIDEANIGVGLADSRVYRQPIAGGPAVLVYTHDNGPYDRGGIFALKRSGANVWLSFNRYMDPIGTPSPLHQQTGFVRIDTTTLVATEFLYSDGDDGGAAGVPHLLNYYEAGLCDDGGYWYPVYDVPVTGGDGVGLVRLDTADGTFDTVIDLGELWGPIPDPDGSSLMSARFTPYEIVKVLADGTVTEHPCSSLGTAALSGAFLIAEDAGQITFATDLTSDLTWLNCGVAAGRPVRVNQHDSLATTIRVGGGSYR